jgi:hypothetical protein
MERQVRSSPCRMRLLFKLRANRRLLPQQCSYFFLKLCFGNGGRKFIILHRLPHEIGEGNNDRQQLLEVFFWNQWLKPKLVAQCYELGVDVAVSGVGLAIRCRSVKAERSLPRNRDGFLGRSWLELCGVDELKRSRLQALRRMEDHPAALFEEIRRIARWSCETKRRKVVAARRLYGDRT